MMLTTKKDWNALLDLALAIGSDPRPEGNCAGFVDALLKQQGAQAAAVWINDAEAPRSQWMYAHPSHEWPRDLPLRRSPGEEMRIEIIRAGKTEEAGVYAILPLGDLGGIALYWDEVTAPGADLEWLPPILERFAVSLAGSLAYGRLKSAQEQLALQEAKSRQIIDTSLDAVVIVDANAKVREWSRRASEMFGYSSEEAEGQILYRLIIPPENWAFHQQRLDRFQRTSKVLHEHTLQEHLGIRKDGARFPMELRYSYIRVQEEYLFCVFVRDVTRQKTVEKELRQAKQEAEAAKLAQQRFLADMSHEIRNPVNAIIGMIHLLADTPLSPAQQEYLDALRFSADSLMGVIDSVLDLAKIEAGEIEFEARPFILPELLESLRRSYGFRLKGKPVEFVLQIQDDRLHSTLSGDVVRLNQILTNLLDNAVKFTEQGRIGVSVRLSEENKERPRLAFSVFDTGMGIDEAEQALIFTNFKQAGKRDFRKHGGAGLGLPIVKQLVELQGGTIRLESSPGEGTTFFFELPFKWSEAAPKALREIETQMIQNLHGVEILLAEDDPLNRKLTEQLLRRWQCRVSVACDETQWLKMLESQEFDLILIDLRLSDADGVDLVRRLRRTQGHPNRKCPAIALTAKAFVEERERALAAGMNDFIAKPFSPHALHAALARAITMKGKIAGLKRLSPEAAEKSFPYLLALSNGDRVFMREMVNLYLTQTPETIAQLRQAQMERDRTRIVELAHRLKVNFQMVDLAELGRLARILEKQAEHLGGVPVELDSLIEEIARGAESACEEVAAKLAALDQ
jgi:PAS domain S-box-containing protein